MNQTTLSALVVEEGIYQVIVITEYSGVQHPIISMLFIP